VSADPSGIYSEVTTLAEAGAAQPRNNATAKPASVLNLIILSFLSDFEGARLFGVEKRGRLIVTLAELIARLMR
jgi:hypothetical protein